MVKSMVMAKKRILFVCKHNLFRSQVAESFFKKMNKNKKYVGDGAGIIEWDKKKLAGDKAYEIERKVVKRFGIKLGKKSKSLSSGLLKKTNIVVIVADDVPVSIFKKEKSFEGKIILWKTKDVKAHHKNKEKVATDTIKFIEKKVKTLVKNLK